MQKLFSWISKYFYVAILVFVYLYVAKSFLISGLLPIPSDTIVGLYHPFRDYFVIDYPQGIPFKNFLITDPVRQIIPWKIFSMQSLINFELPLWNPYEMAGKPHLANFQSSAFYPFNLLLLVTPFTVSWSFFILLQPVFAGIFTYAYLRNLSLRREASLLGAITFSLSAFSSVWLEWGNVVHTALWLPILLLSIDRTIHFSSVSMVKLQTNIKSLLWPSTFVFALVSSIFAGHLQVFTYVFFFTLVYLITRLIQQKKQNLVLLFGVCYAIFTIVTFIQWYPTLQFILLSARDVDVDWTRPGWFLPVNHLIQFVVPDFFGNPTTGNYWGTWNYAELNGYVGLIGLLFASFAVIARRDKKTLFFIVSVFVALIFALDSPIAHLPFNVSIPFISTAQPTRLLFIVSFSSAILAALGFDYFLKNYSINRKKIARWVIGIVSCIGIVLISLWLYTFLGEKPKISVSFEVFEVARNNLKLPAALLLTIAVLFYIHTLFYEKNKYVRHVLVWGLIILSAFDLLRFSLKFNSFTKKKYFFPTTKSIEFLQSQKGIFRIASLNSQLLPPNFSTYYKLQSLEGYDPLYLLSYAEFISVYKRGRPDITPPFGFNRIIEFQDTNSSVYDMVNVKYILSFNDLVNPKYKKVFQEGQTKIYKNLTVLPRAYFAKHVYYIDDQQEAAKIMFSQRFNPQSDIVVEGLSTSDSKEWSEGSVNIKEYGSNKIVLETNNEEEGFLILTDSFYPTWKAKIVSKPNTIDLKVYKANMNFRGVIIPKGSHTIEFYITLL